MPISKSFKRRAIVSAINVTPLTDVALVLLVIFMITTPFLVENAIKMDLPDAQASTQPAKDLTLSIQQDGKMFLEEEEVTYETLVEKIKIYKASKNPKIFRIRADENIPYKNVIRAIDAALTAGIESIGLVTESVP